MLTKIRVHLMPLTVLAGMLSQSLVHPVAVAAEKKEPAAAWLDTALTFHASFDHGADADFGKGDRRLFTAPSLNDRKIGQPGLPENGAVSVVKGEGRFGDALQFHRAASDVVFYQVQQNLLYSKENWSGSISFWLKLDPNKDLPPGYCDPLFITPRTFNDGALWVDFSDKSPRQFRHGAIPDRKIWDPNLQDFDKIPEAERPLVTVTQPPFSGETWTHIVIAFTDFNTGKANGWGLYNYVGNAQEWVVDGGSVEARGGAFEDMFSKCDIALEKPHDGNADKATGFRVVLDLGS